jgi:hypothetical protein
MAPLARTVVRRRQRALTESSEAREGALVLGIDGGGSSGTDRGEAGANRAPNRWGSTPTNFRKRRRKKGKKYSARGRGVGRDRGEKKGVSACSTCGKESNEAARRGGTHGAGAGVKKKNGRAVARGPTIKERGGKDGHNCQITPEIPPEFGNGNSSVRSLAVVDTESKVAV